VKQQVKKIKACEVPNSCEQCCTLHRTDSILSLASTQFFLKFQSSPSEHSETQNPMSGISLCDTRNTKQSKPITWNGSEVSHESRDPCLLTQD